MGRHETFRGARWAPSRLRRMLRSRLVHAAVLAIAAAVTIVSLGSAHRALQVEQSRWGATTQVAVLVRGVEAGELIRGAVEMLEVPVAVVPDGAAAGVNHGARAKTTLYRGEVLLLDRVTHQAASGLTPGTVALTALVTAQLPMVQAGDLVDLWTADSANLSSHQVAWSVVVLDISDQNITVAVPDALVADVVVAALRPITVTLVG